MSNSLLPSAAHLRTIVVVYGAVAVAAFFVALLTSLILVLLHIGPDAQATVLIEVLLSIIVTASVLAVGGSLLWRRFGFKVEAHSERSASGGTDLGLTFQQKGDRRHAGWANYMTLIIPHGQARTDTRQSPHAPTKTT